MRHVVLEKTTNIGRSLWHYLLGLVLAVFLVCFALVFFPPAEGLPVGIRKQVTPPGELGGHISEVSVRSSSTNAGKVVATRAGNIKSDKPNRFKDVEIEQKIREEIQDDPFIQGGTVRISVKDGTATLEGLVRSWAAHAAATADAFQGGAIRVRNRLKVTEDESLADKKGRDLDSALKGPEGALGQQARQLPSKCEDYSMEEVMSHGKSNSVARQRY